MKIYVFRCDDGCEGIVGSWDNKKAIAAREAHWDDYGHFGHITVEGQEVIEQ